jgi:hypothetical protein
MDESETIAGVATAHVEAAGVLRADRQLGRGAAIAEALVGQLLRAPPRRSAIGTVDVDKIRPDMLGERALIPAPTMTRPLRTDAKRRT